MQEEEGEGHTRGSCPRGLFLWGGRAGCNKGHRRPCNSTLPLAGELAVLSITCKIAMSRHGPWCWEARTPLQLPVDLQEAPGWTLWQEKPPSRLGLAPQETTARGAQGCFKYTKSSSRPLAPSPVSFRRLRVVSHFLTALRL